MSSTDELGWLECILEEEEKAARPVRSKKLVNWSLRKQGKWEASPSSDEPELLHARSQSDQALSVPRSPTHVRTRSTPDATDGSVMRPDTDIALLESVEEEDIEERMRAVSTASTRMTYQADFAARTWCVWVDEKDQKIIGESQEIDGFVENSVRHTRKPCSLMKFGRKGDPHKRDFVVKGGKNSLELMWSGGLFKMPGGKVKLKNVKQFIVGQKTDVFKRKEDIENFEFYQTQRSFSLVYESGGKLRSLDIACERLQEWMKWVVAIFEYLDQFTFMTTIPNEAELRANRREQLEHPEPEHQEHPEQPEFEQAKEQKNKEKKLSFLSQRVSLWEENMQKSAETHTSTYVSRSESIKQCADNQAGEVIQKLEAEFLLERKEQYERYLRLSKQEQIPFRQEQTRLICQEIVSSEKVYLDFISVISDFWLASFSDLVFSNSKFKEEHIAKLFSNIEEIVPVHKSLYNSFHKDCSPNAIAKAFIEQADHLKVYAAFVNNYEQANIVYGELCEIQGFEEWMKQVRRNEEVSLNLLSHLIMPVQRLPRYRLLLAELIKYSEDHSPITLRLRKAHKKVESIAFFINEQNREAENKEKALALAQSIQKQYPDLLSVPSRELLYDALVIEHRKKPIHVFVFNDIFLYTTQAYSFKGAYKWSDLQFISGASGKKKLLSLRTHFDSENPLDLTIFPELHREMLESHFKTLAGHLQNDEHSQVHNLD